MKQEIYNKDYFENGIKKKLSCYENYKWQETRTLETVSELIRIGDIKKNDVILDFGCAKGYIVKAFTWLGYKNSFGVEISQYAIDNADKEIEKKIVHLDKLHYLTTYKKPNVIICKDVAEHISYNGIESFFKRLYNNTTDKLILIVPLGNGKNYNIPRFDLDVTHIIREDKKWWLKQVKKAGFKIYFETDNLKRIKPNYNVPNGNLLIYARTKWSLLEWLKMIFTE